MNIVVDVVKLNKDFLYVIVENHVVGSVVRRNQKFKFCVESYIENVFCPEHVGKICRVGNEAAAIHNVTARLKGK